MSAAMFPILQRKVVLKNFQNSHENIYVKVFSLTKLKVVRKVVFFSIN